MVVSRRSLLLTGAAIPTAAYGQCVVNAPAVDACLGGVRNAGPAGATLDLNFMFPGSMPPGVTFTRASTATYTDASGVIQTAAVNQPRWDYAGGSLRGLLIEEARTNLFLNSATLSTQSVAVTAQAYTLSFYGTGTVTKSGAATGALVGTGAGQRVTQTFTPTAGTLTCTVTGSVTNAQIEAGSFVTSWIPSAGATATRAADVAVIPTSAWFSATAGTIMSEALSFNSSAAGAFNTTFSLNDGGASNRIEGVRNSDATNLFSEYMIVANSYVATAGIGTVVVGTPYKAAMNYAAGSQRGTLNGAAVTSLGTSAALSPVTQLTIGSVVNAQFLNGYIRRVQYWPRVLSDAEMRQVTT